MADNQQQGKIPGLFDTALSFNQANDYDNAFILAAGINLYIESLRRTSGRILLGPSDIPRMFEMCEALLAAKGPDVLKSDGKGRIPTEADQAKLLQAVEAEMREKAPPK